MDYEEHYCTVAPGIRIHYIDEGQGRPIVFVTGFAGSASGFAPQIEYFKRFCRVIAMDPRNHGKSSYSAAGNTYAQQGRDLAALLAALGLDHVVLVGWSFGAFTVLNYLEQFGMEHTDAFVTIDNPPCALTEDAGEYRAGDLDMLRDFHFRCFQSEEGFAQFVTQNFIDGIFFIHPPKDPRERAEILNGCLRLPLAVGDALIVDGHLSDKRKVMKEADAKMPCMFYVADYRKEAGLRCLPRDYPHSRVLALGNHMVFREFPAEFNSSLEAFLKEKRLLG